MYIVVVEKNNTFYIAFLPKLFPADLLIGLSILGH